ncbi:lipid A-modifier LpxR family protein [Paracoccus sp. (in: a-proteobacteria)]|uniref:lipid A-modifier LpxR family protein n=1 Tax=Paracoccus sp. TaxID=267 RepID=UPI003220097A
MPNRFRNSRAKRDGSSKPNSLQTCPCRPVRHHARWQYISIQPPRGKRPFVADVTYGVAMVHGRWRIALARYHRSREFHGQKEVPVYGTLTIGRRFYAPGHASTHETIDPASSR